MRVGDAAARLLVQGLVVPEADDRDAQQLGGRLPERGVEREGPDRGVVLPEVHALHERLLVPALRLERHGVLHRAGGDGVGHEAAVPVELVGVEEVGHDHEPVSLEGLDPLLVQHKSISP